MADAPSGGGGWGALEVILALVLAIGLITTLTGGTIQPLFGTDTGTKKTTTNKSASTTASGCGIVVSRPKTKEKVDTAVTVVGSIPDCITGSNVPDTLNAQVVDSTGNPLSVYTSIPINKGFFGLGSGITFNATIPLVGVARSTTGYLILTSPQKADGSVLTTRVAIIFAPGSTTYSQNAGQPTYIPTVPNNNGGYFVPNPSTGSGQTTTYTNTNTNTNTSGQTDPNTTYTPPASNNNGGDNTNTGGGTGGGSNTF